MSLLAMLAMSSGGFAQDASYYQCTNRAIPITIPAMPLSDAIEIFTQATRCPVSLDTEVVGRAKAGDVPTARVRGRFTPAAALRQMLSSSPLKSRAIKGGYSIYQN